MITGKVVERLNDVPGVMRFDILRDAEGIYQGSVAPRDHSNVTNYSSEELHQFDSMCYVYKPSDESSDSSRVCASFIHNRPERSENPAIRAKALEIRKAASPQYRPTSGGLAFPQDIFSASDTEINTSLVA